MVPERIRRLGHPRANFALAHLFGVDYLGRPKAPTRRAALDANFAIVVDDTYWANRQGTAEMRWGGGDLETSELISDSRLPLITNGVQASFKGPLVLMSPARPPMRRAMLMFPEGKDPIPAVDHPLIEEQDISALKGKILESGLTISQLVSTAWASASTFRGTDKRGGANGARLRLSPQKFWEVNQPVELVKILDKLESIQTAFNGSQSNGKKVSLADLIVLGGCAAVEEAAKKAGHAVDVPFTPGRMDASQDQTDVESFAVLEPTSDGFRNYLQAGQRRQPEKLLLDRAHLLTLSAPEMVVLVGGLRALNVTLGQSKLGVFTNRPETLTNDFFVNLLDMDVTWQPSTTSEGTFEGRSGATGEVKWTGTNVDLVFGSNSQLRALSEVYACDDSGQAFVHDFVRAWTKVMNLDRFDLT